MVIRDTVGAWWEGEGRTKRGVKKKSEKQTERHVLNVFTECVQHLCSCCLLKAIFTKCYSMYTTVKLLLTTAVLLLLKASRDSVYKVTCMYEPKRVISM